MPTFKTFEDIKAWQKARELTRQVYAVSSRGRFARDWALQSQIRRACISIMSNIAEGFERDGRGEFVQFLAVAKGSAGEVKSQLYAAADQGYVSGEESKQLMQSVDELTRIIAGLIGYLRETKVAGLKYKSRPTNPTA